MDSSDATPASSGPESLSRKRRWSGVLLALVYPMVITWGYFVAAEEYATGAKQSIFLIVKVIQFAFPVLWVVYVLREPLRTGRASTRGLLLGAAFSTVVVGAGWLLFNFVLRDLAAFTAARPSIDAKIRGFGIDSLGEFAVLAGFYSLGHSLLEEYYWRWFVFRQLRRLIPLWPAIVVSALGFMGHHVIVLHELFKASPWMAWLLSAGVAVGGAFWAWLYERTESIFGPWLSHLLIDAGIFWICYDLIRQTIAS